MRPWILALLVVGCKKDEPTETDTDAPTVAEFGLDARPANPTCLATPERLVEDAEIAAVRVWPSVALTNPVGIFQAPGDPDHWYVIEQAGRVKRFDGREESPAATVVLDRTGSIASGGEAGLLGLAFHPDFQANGVAFLSYTTGNLVSRLVRVQTSDNGATWDAGSITDVLTVDQPFSNHNGGHIEFGVDGMLYWGLGDGGSAGDPGNRAQNLSNLLGKILRIDVNTPPYAVPPDNPFVGVPDARPEIYAYGLRNPWRFSIDRATGDIWAGDVGQNAIEEVDLIRAGGNYGWRIKEGTACYATSPCEGNGLIDPVVEYSQNPGFSVMGGVVYRGTAIPELVGTYLFSDYYHGRILAITYDPLTGAPGRTRLLDTGRAIVHFALDASGEVFFLDRTQGSIWRIEPVAGVEPAPFPARLSETGCFDPTDPTQPVDGLIPYDLNHPFWSDGAEKTRWLAVPDGSTVSIRADGGLEFPVGSVLVKEFTLNGRRVETRLFMHHGTGEWAGYSYRWRDDGSDADLVRGEVIDVGDARWEIPSRAACMQCHTEVAGRTLGPELKQLARSAVYPSTNRLAPQLDTLAHIGLIELPATPPVPYPALDDADASAEERARTWLHVNCSMCHQPDGPARGDLDLRYAAPLAATGLCDAPIEGGLGIPDPLIVNPGNPAFSVLMARITSDGAYRMPPIASLEVDEQGAQVIDAWIRGLTSCP